MTYPIVVNRQIYEFLKAFGQFADPAFLENRHLRVLSEQMHSPKRTDVRPFWRYVDGRCVRRYRRVHDGVEVEA